MKKSQRIRQAQARFLATLRKRFIEEHPIDTPLDLTRAETLPVLYETCPHCKGRGYQKGGAFCHRCGSTGKVRVKP